VNVRGFEDYAGRELRLTDERLDHIERRPEMVDQLDRIAEVLLEPDEVRVSGQDESVHLYYRQYSATPVTEKFLLVVANVEVDSPFVITVFYTDRLKSGRSLDIERARFFGGHEGYDLAVEKSSSLVSTS